MVTVAIVGLGSLQLGLDAWSFVLVYGIQLGLALVLVAPWLYALDDVVRPAPGAVLVVAVSLMLVWLLLIVLPLLWSFGAVREGSLTDAVAGLPDQLSALAPLIGMLLVADLFYLVMRTMRRDVSKRAQSEQIHPIPAHVSDRVLHRALVHIFFVLFGPLVLHGMVASGWSETHAIVAVYVGLEFYLLLHALKTNRKMRD